MFRSKEKRRESQGEQLFSEARKEAKKVVDTFDVPDRNLVADAARKAYVNHIERILAFEENLKSTHDRPESAFLKDMVSLLVPDPRDSSDEPSSSRTHPSHAPSSSSHTESADHPPDKTEGDGANKSNVHLSLLIATLPLAFAKRGEYDARVRCFLREVCSQMKIEWKDFATHEDILAAQIRSNFECDDVTSKTKSKKRWWKIGAAAVIGGTALALTGGLAAPAVAGVFSVIGVSGGVVTALSSTVLVTSLFGAAGAGLAGYKLKRVTDGLSDFTISPAVGQGMQVVITVRGFIPEESEETEEYGARVAKGVFNAGVESGEHLVLDWETENLRKLGKGFKKFLQFEVAKTVGVEGLKRVGMAFLASLAWPATLVQLSSVIDNSWAIGIDRSEKAGKLLARLLMDGVHGHRPVNLVGYSLGARLICECLLELEANSSAGIVQHVVLMGTPITADKSKWRKMRAVVCGRMVNAYSDNDWSLSFLYRAQSLTMNLAGIDPVTIDGLENINVSSIVDGHLDYALRYQEILDAVSINF